MMLGVSTCSFWWVSRVRVGGWGFTSVVVLGFCGSLFTFCFLFLGVPFIYFLWT